jgi:hypothetical protein
MLDWDWYDLAVMLSGFMGVILGMQLYDIWRK